VQRIVRPPWAYFLSPLKIGPVVMINGAVLHGQSAVCGLHLFCVRPNLGPQAGSCL